MQNQFECLNVNGMTHFDLAVHNKRLVKIQVRLLRRYSTFVMRKNYTFLMCSIHEIICLQKMNCVLSKHNIAVRSIMSVLSFI